MYSVIFFDPKRRRPESGAEHTLHASTCADVARAAQSGGGKSGLVQVVPLDATDTLTALTEAADITDDAIDPAPCAA